ncbi:sulfurtransferase [soil metagenome]|jgi:thiosulfate/3-mercaptopyruvate sulfurtransferase
MGPIVTAATQAALPVGAIIVQVESAGVDQAAQAYEAGHLPGARLVDRDRLTAASMRQGDGRHPLPSPQAFAQGLSQAGIGWNDTVVAYDREQGASAGRLVYLLRILGQAAALLDGGLGGWDGALETGPPPPVEPVDHQPRPWPVDRLVDADAVWNHVHNGGVVLDARAAPRFRGETEPLDPVAGHIPGAVNAPYVDNLDGQGLFRAPPKLHSRYQPLGADEQSIVYCGSGVSACHDLLAIEHAGLGLPRLYVGSWSQWCRDEDRPVATGPA